jgi:tripartite-type tricarboxylate transporter receptor subunit TctC
MKKESFLTVSAIIMLVVMGGLVSTAYPAGKEYPNKPIQLILPHTAGGGIDLFLRLLSEELKKTWKVPVNIINKPGGGGVVAAAEVANAEKDGYTLLGMLLGQLAGITVADPKSPVNLLRYFDPLEVNSYAALTIVTRTESNLKSFDDVLEFARKKPGELIMGTTELGATIYLEALLLNRHANIKITIVPLQGTSEIIPNVLGGHFQLGFINDVLAKPYLASGKMRALVSDIKSPHLDCPTFAEKGYPQVNLTNAMAILGPKGLPPAVVKVWENTLEKVVKEPNFISAYQKLGYNIDMITGADRLNKRLKEEMEKYSHFTPEELGWKK